ncbi:aminoacyl-tRNA hydrolase [Alkanindiges hydrocarboniclasticus]|uniref:Peptidyl-tRNA hydrolase n=1 Tax=Alkanindiges hydrocarboniclasticus TaxID=1907941 RepID=A0A1S8CUM0_9GAMM|nr:aminoacyl-tRNA hydrolase [Alkanindiges hydrocarboniclasticus]ONG39138.1 aminoacyl-tRNA hydrolase [Alkanindiges hydrocarboniclasticus]
MNKLSLIVGLGNPGSEYAQTRHNAGFWYVQQLADQYRISLKNDPRFFGISGRGTIEGQEVRLLLPSTFMNRSGQSVAPFVKFFQIPVQQILIAHDELDMPAGTIRLKTGGGHGGHNGLRDIVPHIGADFHRLRIGIGHPGSREKVTGHVLGKAPPAEQNLFDQAIEQALQQTHLLVNGDVAKAMNQLNAFKPERG